MSDSIDLNPGYLAIVARILAEYVPEYEVRAFGSRAAWTARDYSDLDLAVVGEGPLNWRTIGRLKEAFEESRLPMQVDVLDWHAISEGFREVIEGNYVVLQKGKKKQPTRSGWDEVALKDVAELVMGQSPPGSTYNEVGDGLPFFQGIRDFNYRHPTPRVFCSAPTRIAQTGDILFSVRAPIGRVNVADRECATGRGLAIIRPLAPSDARYLEFVLRNLESTWDALETSGSVFGNATKRDLESLALVWPNDASERSAIAHVLGALDDKIELNRRMNETLEEMARALFKSWFVDFDPVRAKMGGRWRRGESLPGLHAEHYDLFPDRLVPSDLGEIPEGWDVKALGDVASQRRAGVKPDQIDPATPYIGLEHIPRRCITLGNWDSADGLASGKSRFRKGDILFGKLRPYFHKVGVAPVDGVCSTDIVVLTPKSSQWFGFVLGHTSSKEFVDYTDAASTGTRMPRTKWAEMAQYEVALPSVELATSFSETVKPWIDNILTAIHESHTLAAYRDALLPGLVSGEVAVETE